MSDSARRYLTEFLCTFSLVLTIHGVVAYQMDYGPAVIGFALVILVYISGPISRAHLNPSSTALFISRKGIRKNEIFGYLTSIFAGSLLAALLSNELFPLDRVCVPHMNQAWVILAEFWGTASLLWVIGYVALIDKTSGNRYYGVAIAGIVFLNILIFGEHSYACFNPAVTLSFMVSGMCSLEDGSLTLLTELLATGFSILLFSRVYAPYTAQQVN